MMHNMIEKLTKCAEMEFEKGVENVDTKEMGEVVDIIKDLAEAMYYRTLVVAMEDNEYGEDYDEYGPMEDGRRGYRGQPRSKTSGRYMSIGDGRRSNRGRRGYDEPMGDYEMTPEMYDAKEGRSGMSRKTYMETKQMHTNDTQDSKNIKAKKLDEFFGDLYEDMKEMAHDMSNEEKTVWKQRVSKLNQLVQ